MARDFNGTSDSMDLGNNTNMNGQFPMTVFMWVLVDVDDVDTMISRGESGLEWNIYARTGGKPTLTKLGIVDIQPANFTNWQNTNFQFVAVILNSAQTNVRFFLGLTDGTTEAKDVSDSNGFLSPSDTVALGVFESMPVRAQLVSIESLIVCACDTITSYP